MTNFEKQTWYNKNDVENEAKRIPISATHLNRIEAGVEGAYTWIGELETNIYATIPAIAPYLTFVGNANANMIAAAFGKGNENECFAIGKALKMYANFKSEAGDFSNLEECKSLSEIRNNPSALKELLSCESLLSFVESNGYSYEKLGFFKNPKMTGSSSPSGKVTCSDLSEAANAGKAYAAFDGNVSSAWSSGNDTNSHWIKYDFGYEVRPYKMKTIFGYSNSTPYKVILQGSVDDVVFENITEEFSIVTNAYANPTVNEFSFGYHDKKYRYFRALCTADSKFIASCNEWEIHCIDA